MNSRFFWPEPLGEEEVDALGNPWEEYSLDENIAFTYPETHLALFQSDGLWIVYRYRDEGDEATAWPFAGQRDAQRAYHHLVVEESRMHRRIWREDDDVVVVRQGSISGDLEQGWAVVWRLADKWGAEIHRHRSDAETRAADLLDVYAEELVQDNLEARIRATALRRCAAQVRASMWEYRLGSLLRQAQRKSLLGRGRTEVTTVASIVGVSRATVHKVLRGELWR